MFSADGCAGVAGTVMSITTSENATFMHGVVGANAGCADHQDWCCSETLVLAFAVSRDGMRAMIQLTMRVRGRGQAQAAAAYLRENKFGPRIVASEP